MKTLLLLGGSRYMIPVIDIAHKLGLYVVTCDYLPDNIAHKFSDEYWNISIIDKDSVLMAAEKNKIDGIMSFACDPGVVVAAYVAEQMGLPSPGPYRSIQILQNKGLFRSYLKENGFNVPLAKSYKSIELAMNDINLFHFPLMVKPTDSAGSKGVTRVDSIVNLRRCIEYALKFSRGNEFIIEEFINQKGCSSDCDCFSIDGEIRFMSFSAQRFDKKANNPYTPSAYSWPGTISLQNQEILTSEIQRLLKLLKMGTSIYNIETREDEEGNAYIMECSPRGGGNRLAEMVRYSTGVDLVENSVRAAVGMKLVGLEQRPYNGFWAEIILHSNISGIYDSLWISDEIQTNLVEKDIWVTEGSYINVFSGANETIGTLIFKFENSIDLENVILNQEKYIKVKLK